ncbi:Protein CBG11283, partial [Caenorhabditis briggsae]
TGATVTQARRDPQSVSIYGVDLRLYTQSRYPATPTTERKGKLSELVVAEHTKWFSERTDMDENPIKFWTKATSQEVFPTLYRLHLRFFSAPATTAEAERLFSSAKNILTDNRKLQNAENFSKLLILQQNVKLMGFHQQNSKNN